MPKPTLVFRIWTIVGTTLLFVFLLAPIAVMVPASFTSNDILVFPPEQFSLRWYAEVLESREWLGSAAISLQISIIAMVLATGAGVLIGFVVYLFGPIGTLPRLLLLSPMLVPHVVLATGLFEILVPLGMLGAHWVLAIAQATMALPVTVILSITAFESIDRNIWIAARSLGARWEQIVVKVMLPITATSILACLILAFESAWHEVTLAVFIGPPVTPTLPSRMFSYLLQESTPALAAVCTLLLLITFLGAIMVGLLSQERAQKRPGQMKSTAHH